MSDQASSSKSSDVAMVSAYSLNVTADDDFHIISEVRTLVQKGKPKVGGGD